MSSSTKKLSKPSGASLLRKTRKKLSKAMKFMGIKQKTQKRRESSRSPEIKQYEIYNTEDYIHHSKPAITSEEGFNKAKEKASRISMKSKSKIHELLHSSRRRLTHKSHKSKSASPASVASKPASISSLSPASVASKPASISSKPASVASKPASVASKPASISSKPASISSLSSASVSSLSSASVASKPASVASKPASKSSIPKFSMKEIMKSVKNKLISGKNQPTRDDLVDIILKSQIDLREQELEAMRTRK